MDAERISLELVASDADPPLHAADYQATLGEVSRGLRALDAGMSSRVFMQEAVDAPSFLMGGFSIAKSVGIAAIPIIAAWVHGRSGRKVRLKVGDIEAEAHSVKEIEALLKQADSIRPRIIK